MRISRIQLISATSYRFLSTTISYTAQYLYLIFSVLLKDKGYFSQVPAPLYTSSPGQGTIIPCQYDPQASWPPAQIFWRKVPLHFLFSRVTCFFSLTLYVHLIQASYMPHLLSYQHKLIKMRLGLANLNHCAVPFLSRAAAILCCYYYI